MSYLLLITQLAGVALLVGTLVLLFFRRIYLDAETKQPIKFNLPLIGEIGTQAPVLVLILVAAFMVVYPLSKMEAEKALMEGEIDTGGKSVTMLIVADPEYQHTQDASGKFAFKVPLLTGDANYRVKFVVDKLIIADQHAAPKNGRIELKPVQWAVPLPDGTGSQVQPRKEISDEELRKLQIGN